MGQDECRKCLALLEALVNITRDLTFMCREAMTNWLKIIRS